MTPREATRSRLLLWVAVVVGSAVSAGCTAGRAGGGSGPGPKMVERVEPSLDDERLTGRSATLLVHGLACPSCATGVEKQLRQTAGVTGVELDVPSGRVVVTLDPARTPTRREIKDAVRHGGAILVELNQP